MMNNVLFSSMLSENKYDGIDTYKLVPFVPVDDPFAFK